MERALLGLLSVCVLGLAVVVVTTPPDAAVAAAEVGALAVAIASLSSALVKLHKLKG